ncbi:MAG: hypothetical protein RQ745_12265 [Longimicrobiales bacterium]|nr:hypothetical protein [Longimicrobiales bacterium]
MSIVYNEVPSLPVLTVSSRSYQSRTVIGGALPGEEYVPLFGVVAARRLGEERFVVADRGHHQVKIFHADGSLAVGLAQRGEGPGEIPEVLDVHVCDGDTLAVVGRFNLMIFTADGKFVRQINYRRGGSQSSLLGVSSGCSRMLLSDVARVPEPDAMGVVEDVIHWWDPRTGRRDTIATAGLVETWTRKLYGSARPFVVPWGTERTVALVGDELLLGVGRNPELRRYGGDGDVEVLMRWNARAERVTMRDHMRYSRSRRSWLEGMPSDPEVEYLFPGLDEYPHVAEMKPIFVEVLGDPASYWVRHFDEESFGSFDTRMPDLVPGPQVWSVFDSTGSWIRDVELPARFELLDVSQEFLTGVVKDTFDVETVEVLRMGSGSWSTR